MKRKVGFLLFLLTLLTSCMTPPRRTSRRGPTPPPAPTCIAHDGWSNTTLAVKYDFTFDYAARHSDRGEHDAAWFESIINSAMNDAAKRSGSGLVLRDVKTSGEVPNFNLYVSVQGENYRAMTAFVKVTGLNQGQLFSFWGDRSQGVFSGLFEGMGTKLESFFHNGWNCN